MDGDDMIIMEKIEQYFDIKVTEVILGSCFHGSRFMTLSKFKNLFYFLVDVIMYKYKHARILKRWLLVLN